MFSTLYENLKKVNEEASDSSDIFKPWSEEEIKELFGKMLKEQGCYQNSDGTWSSTGDVDLSSMNLKVIPVQFKEIKGDFRLYLNSLLSLVGCPEKVGGHFWCGASLLTSLEGCPKVIGGDFKCSDNLLTSLEGCPEKVGGWFDCSNNKRRFTADEVRSLCNVGGDVYA
jgi:hypothetical protein